MSKNKSKNVADKTLEIIDKVFDDNVSTMKDYVARQKVVDYINNELRDTDDGKRLSFKISVDDPDKQHWMKNGHFVKIFKDEFKHATDYYSLSNAERLFILDVSPYLHWEMNILVNEENTPLNQSELAEKLNMDTRTVRRNTKSLEEKKILFIIEHRKEVFYMVNPYIVYIGQHINYCIPQLFLSIGYVTSSEVNKNNSRSNRKKTQEKRIVAR